MWGCCQHIGEKRPKAAGDAVGTTIVLFFIIGITLTVILEIFAGNIAEIMRRRK
ncbi:MATE family efflux transporter [[Clostridium] scindens]